MSRVEGSQIEVDGLSNYINFTQYNPNYNRIKDLATNSLIPSASIQGLPRKPLVSKSKAYQELDGSKIKLDSLDFTSFSIAINFKVDSTSTKQYLFYQENYLEIFIESNAVKAKLSKSGESSTFTVSKPISANTWHTLYLVVEDNTKLSLYLDNSNNPATTTPTYSLSSSSPAYLGTRNINSTESTDYLTGSIANIAIYSKPNYPTRENFNNAYLTLRKHLNIDNFSEMGAASFVVPENGLILDWDVNQYTFGASTLPDQSLYNYSGNITSGVESGSDSLGQYFSSFDSSEFVQVADSDWDEVFPTGSKSRTVLAVLKTPTNTNSEYQFHIFHYGGSSARGAFGLTLISNYSYNIGGYAQKFGAHWWNGTDGIDEGAELDTPYVVALKYDNENEDISINVLGSWHYLNWRDDVNTRNWVAPKMGESISNGEPFETGKIYRIMMYDYAMPDSQIEYVMKGLTDLYNVPYNGVYIDTGSINYGDIPRDGLLVYSSLQTNIDENLYTGSTLPDISGNGLHSYPESPSATLNWDSTPPYMTDFDTGSYSIKGNVNQYFPTGSADRTMMVAFRTPSNITDNNFYHILQYGNNSALEAFGITIHKFQTPNSQPRIGIHTFGGQSHIGGIDVNTDADYIVFVRYSETNITGKVDFYSSGSFHSINAASSSVWLGSDSPFPLDTQLEERPRFGVRVTGGEGLEDGRIYSYALWDRVLTNNEIENLYSQLESDLGF